MPLYINAPDDIDFSRPVRVPAAVLSAPIRRVEAEHPERPRKPLDPAKLNRSIRAAADRHRRRLTEEAKADRAEADQIKRARDLEKQGFKVDGADKGTAPTRAKMKPDTLLWMLDRGQLSQEAYDAALSIRAAYMLITVGMDARIATYGESFGGIGDTWEAAWAVQMQELFNDWCDMMAARAAAAQKVRPGTRRWQTGIVLSVVVDGHTCNEIANSKGMKNTVVADYLRDALGLYTDIKCGKVKVAARMAA